MTRVVVVAVALAVLPPACAKLLGDAPPPAKPDVGPAPAPPPITSATAPPAWHPPEPPTPPFPATSASSGPSADLLKARAAADGKDFKKVRSLLEKKVRGGKCAPEESQLLVSACTALKDRACVADVKAKHGDDLTE